MAEEAIVLFVDIALQDARLDVAPDAAHRPQRRAAPHPTAEDPAVFAEVAWAFEPAIGMDDGPLVDEHGIDGLVVEQTAKVGVGLNARSDALHFVQAA